MRKAERGVVVSYGAERTRPATWAAMSLPAMVPARPGPTGAGYSKYGPCTKGTKGQGAGIDPYCPVFYPCRKPGIFYLPPMLKFTNYEFIFAIGH